jgi:hypothetical protein
MVVVRFMVGLLPVLFGCRFANARRSEDPSVKIVARMIRLGVLLRFAWFPDTIDSQLLFEAFAWFSMPSPERWNDGKPRAVRRSLWLDCAYILALKGFFRMPCVDGSSSSRAGAGAAAEPSERPERAISPTAPHAVASTYPFWPDRAAAPENLRGKTISPRMMPPTKPASTAMTAFERGPVRAAWSGGAAAYVSVRRGCAGP